MLQKGSKSYSIFHLKCPRCHEGETFETGSWSFKKSFDMHQRCSKCDLNYFPEPGYYYGSMFISYIWLAWVSLLSVMFFHWYLKLGEYTAYALLILVVAINFVYIFRISRLMWINMHVKYDPQAIEKHELELASK
jgi:hypothetical protein